ncbi:MAG: undecaprenyl/decaprenyl-phosphate alpha-N-acetylglucosaminyl 1-phosphate transferase [Candidatus Thermofonsia Clade 1 bacterium]|uniref:Undecaprenyl/decaprenyl-phosphate alpha-N-acetylglucosaminyl 1-phosphate transferase n=1 Tax=Candidatus Thermofonsia Clade 1 bacterium TaxID=2364210 RepID=A0A2M8NZS3_9CHLR|nr:MAG: undecaprenyl/decaprenyl-phosphate alpha-N-acetylglucosaminyl 1-phosphate transferase [Candidatus Thermofonsia Clade 1 bacterium]
MLDYVPVLAVGFAASVGLAPLTRQLAQRIGLVDKPNARKVHQMPIPLMGGLSIYLAFLLALLMFGNQPAHLNELIAIVICASFLTFVGFWDDRKELRPRSKYAAQLIVGLFCAAVGLRVDIFGNLPLDLALTLLWYVGIINAVNFLDNMDGLAAGMGAIAAFFLFLLAALQGQTLVSSLSAALCGALIGFLIYNFNPASMFMGDMGSLPIGFLLAVLGLKLRFATQVPAASWMIPILVLGLPIFDMTLVVFTRLREGRSPAQGGKDHTSHRLVAMGLHPRLAVLTLYVACILLGISAILISFAPLEAALVIGGGVGVVGLGSFIILEIVRIKQQRKLKAQARLSQKG